LRNGATLTETADDVISQLGPLLRDRGRPIRRSDAPTADAPTGFEEPQPLVAPPAVISDDDGLDLLLEYLSPTPVAVDELVRQCQMSAASVAMLLLELELAGRIERHPGNLVSLR